MRVLAVGAHPADIELGCGGALLAHRDRGDEIHLLVMTGEGRRVSGSGVAESEQLVAAARLGAEMHWGGFTDGEIPAGRESIAAVEAVLVASGCDVVYCHAPDDTHQDHRAASEACYSAARKAKQVLAFESPSTVNFTPVVYVDLEGRVGSKLELIGTHRSQIARSELVDLSAIAAQARFRGSQARVQHAEGFQTHRFVWSLTEAGTSEQSWGAAHAAGPMLPRHVMTPRGMPSRGLRPRDES